MNFFFASNKLVNWLNSCYPPPSALLNSPDYLPNSQDLSRLTYYASNHPDKISKLGTELEKRLRVECRKARSGNMRSRASLLITLAIIRALATECRRDINLLSASLIASVEATLNATSNDLEVAARAASVFTTWTTYTDGHLVGSDSNLTKNYISCLQQFASLACSDSKDSESRNRTRLIGFAALTGAMNSEALYNDSVQFRAQVSILMRPVLVTLLQTNLETLEQQAVGIQDAPISPYLAEFRTRPPLERRAASIHLHIDGENGPLMSDVSSAALRALFSLLEHVSGGQLGHIMRSSFDNLDELNGWGHRDHCCWLAQKIAEWSQYQYRFAVPTWLVERLTECQDAPTVQEMHTVLIAMVTSVFDSPVPLINLSTSDILSNLMSILIRRITMDPEDQLPPALVKCISSLGSHVYYSDQIQDLAGEIISRLSVIEVQGVVSRKLPNYSLTRSQALRCLTMSLSGLIFAANRNEPDQTPERCASPTDAAHKDAGVHDRPSRRTRVPPDIWQDTLSLLYDGEFTVRADYTDALIYYLAHEMPKHDDSTDAEPIKRASSDGPLNHSLIKALMRSGDPVMKLLNALHSYLYILVTTASLDSHLAVSDSPNSSPDNTLPTLSVQPATPLAEKPQVILQPPFPSQNDQHNPRSRKVSKAFRLLQREAAGSPATASACLTDYCDAFSILATVHEQLPIRGLVAGVPMLLALDMACNIPQNESEHTSRIHTMKLLLARVWLAIGKVWDMSELVNLAEQALSNAPPSVKIPDISPSNMGNYHSPREPTPLPPTDIPERWSGVDAQNAIMVMSSHSNVQEASGLDQETLLSLFSKKWTAELALKESIERPSDFDTTLRGDGVSPLIKLTPGLMHIDNLSLASLARSTRGVGVTDLREALEGRSSMSNPALARPGSISTLDHTSSIMGGEKLTQTRSRSRAKQRAVPSGSGEVRDVLNKLGLGKQNGSLLKASFPALQQRS